MKDSFDKEKEWRNLLKKVGDNLLSDNIKAIIFLMGIPAGVQENLGKDGFDVLVKLQKMDMIDMEDPDTLIDHLSEVGRLDLLRYVQDFKERCYNELRRLAVKPEQKKFELTMSAFPRGICLIISNRKFSSSPIANGTESSQEPSKGLEEDESRKQVSKYDRPHTVDDEASLKETFEWLGFEVKFERDCTTDGIHKALRDMSDIDHTKYDAFVCCILTHGYFCNKEDAVIFGTEWNAEPLANIQRNLEGLYCRSLLDKPKIFFVQAFSDENIKRKAVDYEEAKKVDGPAKSKATESEETQKSKPEESSEKKMSTESGAGKPLRAAESMDEEVPKDSSLECNEADIPVLTDEMQAERVEQQTFDGDINEGNGLPATPDNSRQAIHPAPDPLLPSVKNFMSFISTSAELADNAKKGTTFVSTICDVFQKQACNEDLLSMLRCSYSSTNFLLREPHNQGYQLE